MMGKHTNRSSAVGDDDVLSCVDMVSDAARIFWALALLARAGSRKGFRDIGRGGGTGSSKGETGLWRAGETARLRKGLLEERFSVNPAAGCWSEIQGREKPQESAINQL